MERNLGSVHEIAGRHPSPRWRMSKAKVGDSMEALRGLATEFELYPVGLRATQMKGTRSELTLGKTACNGVNRLNQAGKD